MTLVYKDDVIAALLDIARTARGRTVAKFAEVECDAATRQRLDREIATALDQFEAVVERRIVELRRVAGYA